MTPALDVRVTGARGGAPPVAAAALGRWLARYAPSRARGVVAIALVSDATMRRLNRTFRGVDRPTDVLSFPPAAPPASARPPGAPRGERLVGDVAIALGVAARQARREGHPVRIELRILALHGLLHLLGYDHETDDGAMERFEERLRRAAGLPLGLIRRPPRRMTRG